MKWIAVLLPLVASAAEKRTIYPLQDATIVEGLAHEASADALVVGPNHRALVQFDLSRLPIHATIRSVQLVLTPKQQEGEEPLHFNLYRITAPWTESHGSSQVAVDQDVTWTHSTYPTARWNHAGGDYDKKTLLSTAGMGGKFDSTARLKKALQQMVAGDLPNFGFLVMVAHEDPTMADSSVTFASLEGTNQKERPRMIVEYTLPGGAGGAATHGGLKGKASAKKRSLQDGNDGEGGDTGNDGEGGDLGNDGEGGDLGNDGEGGDLGNDGEGGDLGNDGEGGDLGNDGEGGDLGNDGEGGDLGNDGEGGDTGNDGEGGDTGNDGEGGDLGNDGEGGDTGNDGEGGDTGSDGEGGDTGDGNDGEGGDTGGDGEGGDTGGDGEGGDTGGDGEGGDTGGDDDKPPICFSGDTLVNVQGKGEIRMNQLQIGDYVLTQDASYERVYSFGHYDPESKGEFVVFNHGIQVSANHMVAVGNHKFAPAGSLQVGDSLMDASGRPQEIKTIALQSKQGLYAPFTQSGTIVVSNILASTYISFQASGDLELTDGVSTGLSWQWIAHTFEAPHRLVCNHHLGLCTSETYTPEGISSWVAGGYQLCEWMLGFGVLAPLGVALVMALTLPILAVEQVLAHGYGYEVLAALAVAFLLGRKVGSAKKV